MMDVISLENQWRSRTLRTAAALGCVSVLLYAAPAAAQLTLGGYVDLDEVTEEQVDEQVEEEVTENVEEAVEETAEEQVADNVTDVVEEQIEDQLTLGGFVDFDELVEEQVEDQVAEEVTDDVVDGVEEDVTEDIEEEVAEVVEDSVDEAVGEDVEDVVEEAVEEEVADSAEDAVEEAVEEQVADSTEEALEEQIVNLTEETVADTVTEEVQATVEDSVEASVEDEVVEETEAAVVAAVEDDIVEQTEARVETRVSQTTEAAVEESVAETVSEETEAAVTDAVETQVAETTEAEAETAVTDAVEAEVAETTEAAAEAAVEEQVIADSEAAVEAVVEEQLADAGQAAVDEAVDAQIEAAASELAEANALAATEARLEAEVDEMIDSIESDIDIDERRIHRDQWLVMAEPGVFDELADEGYLFDTFTELPGLGLRLAEVAAPASFDISAARKGIMDVVGGGRAEVDLNHIYTAGAPETLVGEAGIAPRDAMPFPGDIASLGLRIGIVDSSVDVTHPALANAPITARTFASRTDTLPEFHGTAIASIFSASAAELEGIAPGAHLYAAAVFEQDDEQGEIASTVSLVKAIDWLLSSEVDAVNLSLAGPPNRLLEVALKRVNERGVMVLAAAGNGGPMARPMYPAAYETVVAVTAVDERGRAFRLANRGDYLDLAAPGVNVRHALAGGGYAASSGTSFAVPFAVTAAAGLKHREPGVDVLARLYAAATDLGSPGRDDIYGYGLLMP